jgi:anti-sigma factor RsiW
MKRCPKSTNLTALMEGWLDPGEAEALRAHVETCASCRGTLEELETSVSLLAREAGLVEPPARGYEALLDSALAVRDLAPMPPRTGSVWFRRVAAVAAVVLLAISAALLVEVGKPNGVTSADTTEVDVLEELIQEHALATGQIPFSDGSYMELMASIPPD